MKYKRFAIVPFLLVILIICFSIFKDIGYLPILFSLVLLLPIIVLRSKAVKKFDYEFRELGIVVYHMWEQPITIPYPSITRIYLYKGPIEKVMKVTYLIIEFGEKHNFIERIIYWGPTSALGGVFSPGIWGNYCTIPDIDDLKAEELKDKILSYTGEKVEVKRIGLFYI